ncbi:PAS domain-containing protein [uncultured Pseudoxanthomonas sp.]|uniref:PAS domain-containing protein n=1 Tax=uncultured Pseudoxanthomonas sp. TaxID=281701 RepID=UPI00260C07B9|nr:PAS domain-containing protein [uncultured Pseudoxanthomonas sp.]
MPHRLDAPPDMLDHERGRVALASGAVIGTWIWDITTDKVRVDASLERAFGLGPMTKPWSLADLIGSVHPDDQDELRSAIADAVAQGGQYVHRYRTRGTDDDWRWVDV